MPFRLTLSLLMIVLTSVARAGEITVTVEDDHVTHTVAEQFSGTNLVALWNSGVTRDTAAAYAQMGAKLLRFPGGVPAHWYDWEHPLDTGFTELTPQMAWEFAQTSGAEMIFQTNTATDKTAKNKKTGQPYTLTSAGQHYADWVKAAKHEGMKVAFWEIGNEPENDAPAGVKGKDDRVYQWYNAKFGEQAKAMKTADPDAKIMGPASTNEWFWWHEHDLDKFLAAHGNKHGSGLVDAISLHYYPTTGEAAKWETIRGVPQQWPARMDYIRQTIAAYDSRELPVYLTEWNFAAGDKDHSSAQFSTALGNADMIGMFLRTGVAGHTHFCLQHVGKNWGVLAQKNDVVPENHPSPTYFSLAMAAMMGRQVLQSRCSADEANVLSAYATATPGNGYQVMLINKVKDAQSVKLSFTHFAIAGHTAKVYSLTALNGALADTDVTYNGKASPQPSEEKLPDPQSVTIDEHFQIDAAPYSLTLLLIDAAPVGGR